MTALRIGFGKRDITPRVGVQLYGFGSFLNRHATAIRDRLFARAIAASDGERTVVLVSCDLVGLAPEISDEVRQRVSTATGMPRDHVATHCTHTHSGPATKHGIGQGEIDGAYTELLPRRIAQACVEAVEGMREATLHHATVACEGIGYNREQDERPSLDRALDEGWRPERPEITDTQARVLRAEADGEPIGFATYFSCHPVVGGASNTHVHGDFVGVATNMLERERPGSVGLFLQGCEGNINSCVVHHGEDESLLALDVLASRYARQVRPGLDDGAAVRASEVRAVSREVKLPHEPLPEAQVRKMLADAEATLAAPDADDADHNVRRATVYATALRGELARQERGEPIDDRVEVQALRIGDVTLVGAPFEIMHRYRRRVQAQFDAPVLVLSLLNGARGYAPERESFDATGNYAAKIVPYLLGYPPFSPDLEDVLVEALTDAAREAQG